MTNEHIVTFVTSQDSDDKGIGRWSWMEFTGKQVCPRKLLRQDLVAKLKEWRE